MANEKKPSIYVDRGTIGSVDELDEYGVWVKSEPQDLSSAGIEIQGTPELSGNLSDTDDFDMVIPEINDLPDFDSLQEEISKNTAPVDDFDLPEIEADEESAKLQSGESSATETESFDLINLEEAPELDTINVEKEEENEGFTEISMDDFIGTLDTEPAEEEVLPESFEEEPLDQMSADSPAVPPSGQDAAGASPTDLSTQLLMKIAEELSSIRNELSTLKKEFSGLKAATTPVEAGESGFFGEEDDEKISLTGDELNNILNTADFTEEAGADATIGLSEDLNIQEAEDQTEDDISPESSDPFREAEGVSQIDFGTDNTEEATGETSEAEPELDLLDMDISLDETNLDELESDYSGEMELEETGETVPDIADLQSEDFQPVDLESEDLLAGDSETEVLESAEETFPDFSEEESEELKQIRENGAEPMTFPPAPEDENYLTDDPLSETDFEIEDISTDLSTDLSADSIDLSEAVIDEPDLSAEIQDNPLEEPSLEDISISLDLDDNTFSEEIEPQSGESDTGIMDLSETLVSAEEIELPLDLSSEDEAADEDVPVSPDTESGGEGGDLSLIPEGFVVGADDFQLPQEEPEEEILSGPETAALPEESGAEASENIPSQLKQELKTVLSYMDQLLESLPDEKIEEFARSDYYDTYKKLFKELGLV